MTIDDPEDVGPDAYTNETGIRKGPPVPERPFLFLKSLKLPL
jgi:hypothetical protein